MQLIIGERQQGKTTHLIKMSADNRGIIVTATEQSAKLLVFPTMMRLTTNLSTLTALI